jgi:L-threonylcarbamoyladenylate synthase
VSVREIDLTAKSDESLKDLLRPAALAIKDGDLAIVPTTTYYALTCDAFNPTAVRKVFSAKGRDEAKPLPVLVDSFGMMKTVVRELDPRVKDLDWRFGSKGLTYVLEAADRLPVELTAGTGTVAVRFERHEVIQELLALVGLPITGSSANREGAPPPSAVDDALRELRDWVEVAVRSWRSTATTPSTIVDLTSKDATVVREGTVPEEDIRRALAG